MIVRALGEDRSDAGMPLFLEGVAQQASHLLGTFQVPAREMRALQQTDEALLRKCGNAGIDKE